jgi:hypothetical protein
MLEWCYQFTAPPRKEQYNFNIDSTIHTMLKLCRTIPLGADAAENKS